MNLTVRDQTVEIQLTPMERVWACHVSGQIEIPLLEIRSISAERPEGDWRELRAPGSYWPGLIKAGTYYSQIGRAFWYVQGSPDCLCLDLNRGYYRRVVLGSERAGQWRSQLQAALSQSQD